MSRRLLAFLSVLSLLGCSDSGVQGTSLAANFTGLESAEAVSPTAVRLSWSLDPKYKEYRVYQNQSATPLRAENFSTTLIRDLNPATSYTYLVTGLRGDNSEVIVGGTRVVSTMNSFTGLTSGGVTLKSPTEVNLTWDLNSPKTTFKIFHKLQGGSWTLNRPSAQVKGLNQYILSSLQPGETYCFHVQASYEDDTNEPENVTPEGLNGTAPCLQMTTNMTSLPTVTVNSVSPGEFPWFWTANGDPSYVTEVFELGSDTRVASVVGNGTFRSFV